MQYLQLMLLPLFLLLWLLLEPLEVGTERCLNDPTVDGVDHLEFVFFKVVGNGGGDAGGQSGMTRSLE